MNSLLQGINSHPSPKMSAPKEPEPVKSEPFRSDVSLAVDMLSKSTENKAKKDASEKFKKEMASFDAKSEVKTIFVEHKKSMFSEDIDEAAHLNQVHQLAHLDHYKVFLQ